MKPKPGKIAPQKESKRRRLQKILRRILAGEISIHSAISYEDGMPRNPWRRVIE